MNFSASTSKSSSKCKKSMKGNPKGVYLNNATTLDFCSPSKCYKIDDYAQLQAARNNDIKPKNSNSKVFRTQVHLYNSSDRHIGHKKSVTQCLDTVRTADAVSIKENKFANYLSRKTVTNQPKVNLGKLDHDFGVLATENSDDVPQIVFGRSIITDI